VEAEKSDLAPSFRGVKCGVRREDGGEKIWWRMDLKLGQPGNFRKEFLFSSEEFAMKARPRFDAFQSRARM
jgi:hypothetical protein